MQGVSLGQRFLEAVQYAAGAHGGQTRKQTTVPYLAHPLGVCSLVLEDGGDEDEAIAALLHDTAEDVGGAARLSDIEHRFGYRVRQIVHDCSDTLVTPKPPWPDRKCRFVARVREAMADPTTDRGFLRVSLADKVHNVRSIHAEVQRNGDRAYDRFSVPKHHTLAYYNELSIAFSKRHPEYGKLGPMAKQLKWLVKQLGGSDLRLRCVDPNT